MCVVFQYTTRTTPCPSSACRSPTHQLQLVAPLSTAFAASKLVLAHWPTAAVCCHHRYKATRCSPVQANGGVQLLNIDMSEGCAQLGAVLPASRDTSKRGSMTTVCVT